MRQDQTTKEGRKRKEWLYKGMWLVDKNKGNNYVIKLW